MKPVKLSVVIPAYNAVHTIQVCVAALQNQGHSGLLHEIIVVDNGSTDDTAAVARQAGATVIHQLKKGAAAARNAGIEAATGEIICVTDADCCPTTSWLAEVSAPLRANSEIAACKGTYRTNQTQLVARFVQLEYEDKYDLLRPQKTIDFIDTYSAAYRREVLVQNGGFDENVFYVEDQELSFRLASRGYKMVFQPTAVVYHLHAASLASYARKKFFIAYWKAQIVRRFPRRGVKDSHTPQIMKVQMGLSMLAVAAGVLSLIMPGVGLAAVATLLFLFLLTTVPFAHKAWPKDRAVALATPCLLLVRALALSCGYLWGIVAPQTAVRTEQSWWQNLKLMARTLLYGK